ncbi:MAG TPA: matrixin family metalloprotease, partial [Pyrinomonadaceae bacterium]|nr:matrixin family metalloprotease [Pyrinomonadaceae bacterium]
AIIAILGFVVSGLPSSFDLPGPGQERQIKWFAKSIQIALSNSLTTPSAAIKPDSDVLGAVHRALASWSRVANVTFVEVSSKLQSVSPTTKGDGVNLITIAGTGENVALFDNGNTTARTRVFYDSETGEINEADIVINPYPYSDTGEALQFSTDGTPGTYDLESTLTHEIGHLLGLNHSHVIGATMQATQALNGTFGLPAVTERTLSEADRAAVLSLYGSRERSGLIAGRILDSVEGNLVPASAAHVWIEDVETGKVIAGTVTSAAGRFSLSSIPPGEYRAMVESVDLTLKEAEALSGAGERRAAGRNHAFRSVEMRSRLRVVAESITTLNYVLVPPQNSAPQLEPRYIGINGELSTVPVPVVAGKKITLYVGGRGVDQIPGNSLVLSSPAMTIDPATLTLERFYNSTPVISFEVTVAANAQPGDYTLRLQSNSGEVAYLVGALTISPAE